MKQNGEKITMVTCYDATFAKLLNETGIDTVLVGDSLGMVVQGHPNTLPVTVDDVIYHTRCVTRVMTHPHVIADMPFLSYHTSAAEAVCNAGRMLKEGRAGSVKIEGGEAQVEVVKAMVDAGIPVMAHIGLRPQTVHQMGGYKVQGKTAESRETLLKEAELFQAAGAYAMVLECVVDEVATEITQMLTIPTIGIGSGAGCDGQVLVIYDLLGMNPDFSPKFVKKYGELGSFIQNATKSYIDDVKKGTFPAEEHAFHGKIGGELKKLYGN